MASKRAPDAIDELLKASGAATVAEFERLAGERKKARAERMINAEIDVHLDADAEREAWDHRNGTNRKIVLIAAEPVVLDISRERHGRLDPALIGKYQRRFSGTELLG